jgi:hypothetical protein
MRYNIYEWREASGSCVAVLEFANDSECLQHLISLGPDYTAEAQEAGFSRVLQIPNTSNDADAASLHGGYRIYDYVTVDKIPTGNRSSDPDGINYFDNYLTVRLQSKYWIHHGLVTQAIHYANYDPVTGLFSNPVVRETWTWDMEPSTNFATTRTIKIQWYAKDKLEDGSSLLLPFTKTVYKYYTSDDMKIAEIQRRRDNVITDMSKKVIYFLICTKTLMEVANNPFAPTQEELVAAKKAAIALGQNFLTKYMIDVNNFRDHGSEDLADKVVMPATMGRFPWLTTNVSHLGFNGQIKDYIVSEIRLDIRTAMQVYDYNSLPLE